MLTDRQHVDANQSLAAWINVSKQYVKRGPWALKNVNIVVNPGEIVVIVGPNGSGKTTAMEMISGLRVPTSGRVVVGGHPVRPGGQHRLSVGVQLQEAGLPVRIKVKEAIAAIECLYADPGPVSVIMTEMGLDPHRNAMVDSLSGGWQRRLDVALACIGNPRLLVLDEPTSGLDPVARPELWEFLRKRRAEGVGVLASTHDLGEAEAYADRLIVLHRGRVVTEGPVNEVLASVGGEWRLRVIGAGEAFTSFIRDAGVTFVHAGETSIAIGKKETILALADVIEQARDDGVLDYVDLLRGPLRLEDVFAVATQGEHDDE